MTHPNQPTITVAGNDHADSSMQANQQLDFNAADFWQLQAPVRFPARVKDWHTTISVKPPEHQDSYDIIRRMEDFLVRPGVTLHMADLLSSTEWRLLFYLSHLQFNTVSSSSYDPRLVIADACRRNGWLADVPEEWTGAVSTSRLCRSLHRRIRLFTKQEAQTLAVIAAFFRTIGLEKNEVLTLPWFKPEWIRAFLANVKVKV